MFMSARLISIIYFYLISIIGLVLIVVGTYNTVTFVINSTQYEKYPLQWGGLEQCDFYPPIPVPMPKVAPDPRFVEQTMYQPDDVALQRQKEDCSKRTEMERKQHKIDDMKNALTFTIIGLVLFGLHFPIALKRSNKDN